MSRFSWRLAFGVGLAVATMGCQDFTIDNREEPSVLDSSSKPSATPLPDLFTSNLLGSVRGTIFTSAEQISQSQFLDSYAVDSKDNIYLGMTLWNETVSHKSKKIIRKLLPNGSLDAGFKIEMDDPYVLGASDTTLYVGLNSPGVSCIIETYDLDGKKQDLQFEIAKQECGTKFNIVQVQYSKNKLYVLSSRKVPNSSPDQIFYKMNILNAETQVNISGWPQDLGQDLNTFKVLDDEGIVALSRNTVNYRVVRYNVDGSKKELYKNDSQNLGGFHDVTFDDAGNYYLAFRSPTDYFVVRINKEASNPTSIVVQLKNVPNLLSGRVIPVGDSFLFVARNGDGSGEVSKYDLVTKALIPVGSLPPAMNIDDRIVKLSDDTNAILNVNVSNRFHRDSDITRTILNADGTLGAKASIDFLGQANEAVVGLGNLPGEDYAVVGMTEKVDGDQYWVSKVTDKGLVPVDAKAFPASLSVKPWITNADIEKSLVAIPNANNIKVWDLSNADAAPQTINESGGTIHAFKADKDGSLAIIRSIASTSVSALLGVDYELLVQDGASKIYNKFVLPPSDVYSIALAVKGQKVYSLSSSGNRLNLNASSTLGANNFQKSFYVKCSNRSLKIIDLVTTDEGLIAYGTYQDQDQPNGIWIYGFDYAGNVMSKWDDCNAGSPLPNAPVLGLWTGKQFVLGYISDFDNNQDVTRITLLPYNKAGEVRFVDAIRVDLKEKFATPGALLLKGSKLILGGGFTEAHFSAFGALQSMILEFKISD